MDTDALFTFVAVVVLVSFCGVVETALVGQEPNYDESKVPSFNLPPVLVTSAGKPVSNVDQWEGQRRPELLELFTREMYGRSPDRPQALQHRVTSTDDEVFEGVAIRQQVTVFFTDDDDGPQMDLLIYVPRATKPSEFPAFLALNFYGNHTISDDPGIQINPRWMRDDSDKGVTDNRATESSRGKSKSLWAIDEILKRGYALVTIYYGDIDPDFDDGFQNGVHPLGYQDGQEEPAEGQWGSIAAWAWGLSCALDYLETNEYVDAQRVAVLGHSRLGKTALWAGATDPRFALVISNNSGCGGAALSRRQFGETVKRINTSFPHWFCNNFNKYSGREEALPIDQHQLIALIAPRPVYVASAVEDQWADPRGEFLAILHASPAYDLYRLPSLTGHSMPAINQPIHTTQGYHIRSGKHDVTEFDWKQYLDFADRHLKKSTPEH